MDELTFYDGAYSGVQVDAAIARALAGGAIDQEIASLRAAVGSPLVANTISEMTNTNRIYVYTGSEAGYTSGHWYYWNGTAWTDGGAYNSAAADDAMSDSSTNAVENKVIKAYVDGVKTDTTAKAKSAMDAALGAYPTETDSGAIASTEIGADGVPLKSLVVNITPVQEGSGGPSLENQRPISGWTSAHIGVSPSVYDAATNTDGYYYDADLNYVSNAAVTLTDYMAVLGTLRVTLASVPNNSINIRVNWFDREKNILPQTIVPTVSGTLNYSVAVPSGAVYTRISTNRTSAPFAAITSGAVYAVTFPSEAGTAYGGTLAYNGNKTWTLTATHILADVLWGDGTSEAPIGTTILRRDFDGAFTANVAQTGSGCINNLGLPYSPTADRETSHYYVAGNGRRIRVFLPVGTPDTTRIQITGALVTPQTYTLTADDVLSLLGDTNVWADCGDVEATFRCDPTLFINSKVAALTALMSES